MNNTFPTLAEDTRSRRRPRKRWLIVAFAGLWVAVGTWHTVKPMPPGTDVSTPAVSVRHEHVRFLYDLTYSDGRGGTIREQQIFDEALSIVDGAQSFVLVDFFLINDLMGSPEAVHRPLSRELADRLLARKAGNPGLDVLLITDPINDVYGGMPSALLEELRRGGIDVVLTDLGRLRDSNPGYSALWRMFVRWWGNSPEGGWLANPFAPAPTKVTLRSWLALLNFKANHRKVIVADDAEGRLVGLVTSGNPHDASSGHSNVAIRFSGELAGKVLESELAVARFSGWTGHIYASSSAASSSPPSSSPKGAADETVQLAFVTEEAIRRQLLQALESTRNGAAVRMAMFYLADRRIVDALIDAARRGVDIRLILDPNKDAFGIEKDGVPNRPVANELVEAGNGRIEVRWYRTRGEQFHTKMALVLDGDRVVATVGSANLTRRNLGNYNLEANVAVTAAPDAPLARAMIEYFDRLWENRPPAGTGYGGIEYTAPFGAYRDQSAARYWRYRLMESTGLSTF